MFDDLVAVGVDGCTSRFCRWTGRADQQVNTCPECGSTVRALSDAEVEAMIYEPDGPF